MKPALRSSLVLIACFSPFFNAGRLQSFTVGKSILENLSIFF